MDSTKGTEYDPTLLAELTQKVGSREKAKEVYALFAASLMPSAPTAPSLTIPADSAAKSASLSEEGSRIAAPPHAETVSQEAEEEEALHKQSEDGEPTHDETMVETEGKETESPNLEGREVCEGETPISVEVREGETPISVEIAGAAS